MIELIICSVLNLVFFLIGLKIGINVKREQPILPKPTNPVEWYKTKESKKVEEEKQREVSIMLENVDNYDGTSNKQKDIK